MTGGQGGRRLQASAAGHGLGGAGEEAQEGLGVSSTESRSQPILFKDPFTLLKIIENLKGKRQPISINVDLIKHKACDVLKTCMPLVVRAMMSPHLRWPLDDS